MPLFVAESRRLAIAKCLAVFLLILSFTKYQMFRAWAGGGLYYFYI